jgi:hypothetical protein
MKREKINSIMDEFCEECDECRSKEHKEGLDKCAAKDDEFELFHPVGF